jgi:hypothetical protein
VKLPNTKTVRETAVVMETSERNILRLINDKQLDAINVSNGSQRPRWLVPIEAIEKFRPQTEVVTDRPQRPKKRHV